MKNTRVAPALSITDAVAEASTCINSLYPLTNFVACNALKGMENISFTEAMRKSGELFGARGFLSLADYRAMYESGRIAPGDLEEAFARNKSDSDSDKAQNLSQKKLTIAEMFDKTCGYQIVATINKQMVKWCGAYLDRTQTQWRPDSSQGLYAFWKDLARVDLAMRWHGVKQWSQSVESLPDCSSESLEKLLVELDIQGEQVVPYLRQHIVQLPGFASHLKWRELEYGEHGILTDYLAIRLQYEKILSRVASQKQYKSSDLGLVRPLLESETRTESDNKTQQDDYLPVWQDAYELNYRNSLLSSLSIESKPAEARACCQLIFCIDVRSEPMRRRLEQLGPYSTYGFAGFFGMAMRLTELGSVLPSDLCPVLLKPDKDVVEITDRFATARKTSWQALKVWALQLKKKLKCSLAGAFGLVELLGLCSVVPLLAKTFLPKKIHSSWKQFEQSIAGQTETYLDLSAISLDDKIAMAQGTIKGIGLTNFGKLVVLCGHKSSSANNPFASSLDCGACGASGGGFSAQLAAAILNDESVRDGLSYKGIVIPDDTVFLAAEHDTTTDQFCIFDKKIRSAEHEVIFEKLIADLSCAGESLRKERARTLPQSCLTKMNEPLERACDWAQIAPEWGLAGNAAFIAAPRSISKNTDLGGRVFLHSYEYSQDTDSKVLELIMTAPLVVAQWINMQYYLSTVDNSKFGSGSKVVHNVIGDFGVMQGSASDLRMGLPLQSLRTADALRHEPMRLLTVIRAPLSAIDDVLCAHPEVRQLVSNRWIRLVALDPTNSEFYEAHDCGIWDQLELGQDASSNVYANHL